MPKRDTAEQCEERSQKPKSPDEMRAHFDEVGGNLMGVFGTEKIDVRMCTVEAGKRVHFRMAYGLMRDESEGSLGDWMKLSMFLQDKGLAERVTRVEGRWVAPSETALPPTN